MDINVLHVHIPHMRSVNEAVELRLNFLTQPVNLIHRIQTGYLTIHVVSVMLPLSITVQSLVLVFLRFKLTNVAITSNINGYNIALGPVRYCLYWTMINEAIT